MAETELFQIGEVAKMYHLSVGTLRHYEQIGLLKPEFVDPGTGYRYYSVRQFEQLTNIRYLRALGLPLEEIAATLRDRDVDNISQALRRQKALVEQKLQELELIGRKIDRRLAQLEDARSSELDCIRLIEQPALRLVLLRDSMKFNSYLWLERSIRKIEQGQKLPLSYLGKIGVGIPEEDLRAGLFSRYGLVFLVLEEEDVYEGRVETLPPCRCVAVRFRGDHGNAPAHYRQLMEYLAENGLEPAGFSREITLVDNCVSDDPAQYVTEICIPVRPAGGGATEINFPHEGFPRSGEAVTAGDLMRAQYSTISPEHPSSGATRHPFPTLSLARHLSPAGESLSPRGEGFCSGSSCKN